MSWGAIGAAGVTFVGNELLNSDNGSPATATSSAANDFASNIGGFHVGADINTNGISQLNAAFNDPRFGMLNNAGLFNATSFLNNASNNPNAALAGDLGNSFLQQLGLFNPTTVAQQQFNQLNPILQDSFDQDRLNLEARQFAQGRLGSTGGANEFNALLDSQDDSRRQLLFDSFNTGLNTQNTLFNMGTGLTQLDPTIRGLFSNMGIQSSQIPLNLHQSMLNQASILGGLTGASNTNPGSGPGPLGSIGAGLVNAGTNQLTNQIAGLFQPTTGGAFDPNNSFGGGR